MPIDEIGWQASVLTSDRSRDRRFKRGGHGIEYAETPDWVGFVSARTIEVA